MDIILGPLLMLAVLAYLFGTPGYIVAWLVHQRRAKAPIVPGLVCLAIWISSFLFAFSYFFNMSWYGEGTSAATNAIQLLFALVFYVLLPIGMTVHLHRMQEAPPSQP